ncbi:MAG: DUF1330 domain-containing protein [Pseudomonadota bacterium]
MSAYLIVQATVTDPAKFGPYAQGTAALVAKLGGEYIVLGDQPEVLEGDWPGGLTVISRWPSREAAKAFYESPEYTELRQLRTDCCVAHIALARGVDEMPE